ncbi:hypothetical protein SEA_STARPLATINUM_281 [Streptomyces phage StarPlatinum]|uniref:Uncharacterized protein n=1 Tax=Streptomyces phage StarPlatinum TaxID=2283265 RepID=A0A345M8D9_9CAUD|nr:hypothetical protein HWB77_gp011 [Streptomyces phage StarPlatinum]YP_009839674.1 hypothetical protein HWB77_gp052 [Streptomyces phage StarPlatinum]AXH66760.1 hypothetical protein SEA_STARPLATINUM_11 [Streptomyces phage StarPlatinum]AXH66984.1 hypothetical protein SEA_STARPLATINUM_281 [Streptomyces phage StarPlatinum]
MENTQVIVRFKNREQMVTFRAKGTVQEVQDKLRTNFSLIEDLHGGVHVINFENIDHIHLVRAL